MGSPVPPLGSSPSPENVATSLTASYSTPCSRSEPSSSAAKSHTWRSETVQQHTSCSPTRSTSRSASERAMWVARWGKAVANS